MVEYALSRTLSPALIAEYQTQLPDKKLLAAKLHEFYALNAPEDDADKPAQTGEKEAEAMIADLKPYPEYKESGLPWLGQVPGHWEVRRPRHVSDCDEERRSAHEDGRDAASRLCNYVERLQERACPRINPLHGGSSMRTSRIRFKLRSNGDVRYHDSVSSSGTTLACQRSS